MSLTFVTLFQRWVLVCCDRLIKVRNRTAAAKHIYPWLQTEFGGASIFLTVKYNARPGSISSASRSGHILQTLYLLSLVYTLLG